MLSPVRTAELSFASTKPPAETLKDKGAAPIQDATAAGRPSQGEEEATCSMERIYSFSALDCLVVKPEAKVRMRKDKEEKEKKDKTEQKAPKRIGYQARHLRTPVVVVSSEVNPWSKTGGLSMVAASYGYE